jgi:hypothetical protein
VPEGVRFLATERSAAPIPTSTLSISCWRGLYPVLDIVPGAIAAPTENNLCAMSSASCQHRELRCASTRWRVRRIHVLSLRVSSRAVMRAALGALQCTESNT